MLKGYPGSIIHGAPSSAMELLEKSMATRYSPAGHLCMYHEIDKYGLLVQGLRPLPSITLRRVMDGI